RWSVPIHAREAVIFGTTPGNGVFGPRNQKIHRLTLETFLGDSPAETHIVDAGAAGIDPKGTHVQLQSGVNLDIVRVTIQKADVTGLYEGKSDPALAELEVIAQVASPLGAPTVSFIRGDANCDEAVNITDAMTVLSSLFLGGGSLCCNTAGDT